MKKLFKRLLCMVAFATLTVVCARADTTLLVVNQLTPESVSALESKDSVEVAFEKDVSKAVMARVVLFNKYNRYAILAVNDSFVLLGQESQDSYWLRSVKPLLTRVYLNSKSRPVRYSTRSTSQLTGVIGQTVTVKSASHASKIGDDVDLMADNASIEEYDVDIRGQDSSVYSPVSMPSFPERSPVLLEQRKWFRLKIKTASGDLIVFEGTTFINEITLKSLVGGIVESAEYNV